MGIGACRSRPESEKGWGKQKVKLAEGGARGGSIDRVHHFHPTAHSTCSEVPGGRLWWPSFTQMPAFFRVVSAGPGYSTEVFIMFNCVFLIT